MQQKIFFYVVYPSYLFGIVITLLQNHPIIGFMTTIIEVIYAYLSIEWIIRKTDDK